MSHADPHWLAPYPKNHLKLSVFLSKKAKCFLISLKWTISFQIYLLINKDELQTQPRKMPQIAIVWAIWKGQNKIGAILNPSYQLHFSLFSEPVHFPSGLG